MPTLSEPFFSLDRYEPNAVMDAHAHEEASVSVVLGGSISESAGSREGFGNVGDVAVKPPGVEHRNRVASTGAVLLAIKGKYAHQAASGGWRWTHQSRAGAIGLNAAALWMNGLSSDAGEAVLNLLGLLGEPQQRGSEHDARTWLRLVRDRVEDDPAAPSVAQLAEAAGVHPGSLTRAFQRHYGCSVSGYIRRVRVRRAAALLLREDWTVGDIAAAVGSYDQSHLCREFNLELGVSPSSYRLTIDGGPTLEKGRRPYPEHRPGMRSA